MKLKNYYQILEISFESSLEDVKKAYRVQAKKWHPDKNPGFDTTLKMVDINEAYQILSDWDKRKVYDVAYTKHFMDIPEPTQEHRDVSEHVVDSDLEDIINDARFEAEEFVNQFMAELKKTGNEALKGFWSEAMPMLVVGIVISVIVLIMQGC